MVATFRCEHCGETMTPDARGGSKIRCPHCRRRIRVPSALEALPRPMIHPQTAAEAAQPVLVRQDREPVAAGAMPWLFSAMLHVGMFLILLFIVMVTTQRPIELPPTPGPVGPIPERPPGRTMEPVTESEKPNPQKSQTIILRPRHVDKIDVGETKVIADLIGLASAEGGELGLKNEDSSSTPGVESHGVKTGARHAVFVIDSSGSMAQSFDDVRTELLRTIAHLKQNQDFHVIFFANGRYVEGPRRGLVLATMDNKLAAIPFTKGIMPAGKTTALPAIQRALEVLRQADPKRPGKVVYLLTDGDFAGVSGGSTYKAKSGQTLNGNEAVVQYLRENNPGDVMVNTILFRQNDRSAKAVLQTIAAENRGQFKYVSSDE